MNNILKSIILIVICLIIIVAIGFGILILLFIPIKPKVKNKKIKVACIGDSITFGAGVVFNQRKKNSYPAQLQILLGDEYQVLNYGYCGCTLLKSGDHPYWKQKLFTYSKEDNPDIVLIMLGTNDTKPQNWKAEDYSIQLEEMVEDYKTLPGNSKVYLLTPCAAHVLEGKDKVKGNIDANIIENEVVKIIKSVARETNTPVIDTFSATKIHPEYFGDGLHPNIKGNKELSEIIYNALTHNE